MKAFFGALASVIGGEAALRAANVAVSISIARVYGSTVLGAYAGCIALLTAVVMFADNGLQTAAITELDQQDSQRGETAGRLYAVKTVLLGLALLLLAAIAFLLRVLTAFLWALGTVVAIRIALQSYSQLQISFLKALRRARSIGGIQLLHAVFIMISVGLLTTRGLSLLTLLGWLVAGQVLECVLTWSAVRRAGVHATFPARLRFWQVVRKSTPLGAVSSLANLIVRLDVIVLSWLVPLSVLGIFSAANSILLVAYLAAWMFGSLLLPEMLHLSATEELWPFVRFWLRWILALSLPGVCLGLVAVPKLIALLYGPSFAESETLASITLLAAPFILLNAVCTNWAIASHRKAAVVIVYLLTGLATVTLNFAAGWRFGPTGIAAAIVLREAGMFVGFWCFVLRRQLAATKLEYTAVP
jgi:O-antigen/teichoic acid export membrane protein